MTPPLRSVARGLGLVRFGLNWVVVTITTLALGVFAGGVSPLVEVVGNNPNARVVYLWALAGIAALAVVGFIISLVGRCLCLATPEPFATARSRIRLAVILEACGLLSGVANVAVGIGVATLVMPIPVVVVVLTVGLSLLLLITGRVMFLRHLRSLADALDPSIGRVAARSLTLFIAIVTCVAAAIGLCSLAGIYPRVNSLALALCGGCGVAAVVLGVAGLIVYGLLLRRVRDTVNRQHDHDASELSTPAELLT